MRRMRTARETTWLSRKLAPFSKWIAAGRWNFRCKKEAPVDGGVRDGRALKFNGKRATTPPDLHIKGENKLFRSDGSEIFSATRRDRRKNISLARARLYTWRFTSRRRVARDSSEYHVRYRETFHLEHLEARILSFDIEFSYSSLGYFIKGKKTEGVFKRIFLKDL